MDERWHVPQSAALEHGGIRRYSTASEQNASSLQMGPPREHGGMDRLRVRLENHELASMGPPREHGGMHLGVSEWLDPQTASMGPPREHGGMIRDPFCFRLTGRDRLQWGRRVNTAE